MLNTSQIVSDLKSFDRTKDEFLKLIDELIMNENAQIEFFHDQLKDRKQRLEDQTDKATVEHDVRVGYCTQRITLFESMKERMNGKEILLLLPPNPLFPPEETRVSKLFGRKK